MARENHLGTESISKGARRRPQRRLIVRRRRPGRRVLPFPVSPVAEQLPRRRSALGWTLEQVAEQAQVSVAMLSLIETGKRRPSIRSWEWIRQRIRQTLGVTLPLPEEVWRH